MGAPCIKCLVPIYFLPRPTVSIHSKVIGRVLGPLGYIFGVSHAVTKTPKFHQITPILKYLHWLKINERIKYKVLSLI